MKVLFITENPDSPIVKALGTRFDDFVVQVINPTEIEAILEKDTEIIRKSDYHIVADHLSSIPVLRREMNKRMPKSGLLKHLLIAIIEKDTDIRQVHVANMMFYKHQGHIALRNEINKIRPKEIEKPRRHTFVR